MVVEPALAAVPWSNLGAGGLVVLAVLMLLSGRIVPRSVYQDMVNQRDKWEQAWKDAQQALAERDTQLDANTEALKTMESAFNSFLSLRPKDRA